MYFACRVWFDVDVVGHRGCNEPARSTAFTDQNAADEGEQGLFVDALLALTLPLILIPYILTYNLLGYFHCIYIKHR